MAVSGAQVVDEVDDDEEGEQQPMVVSLEQSELAAGGEEANEIRDRVAVDRREDEALIPLTSDESSSFQVIKMMGQGGPRQFEKSLYLIYWQRLIRLYETEENA